MCVRPTSVTDGSYWWWREQDDPLLEQGHLPQNEDAGFVALNKLSEASSRVTQLWERETPCQAY